jgi:hypothetical protein
MMLEFYRQIFKTYSYEIFLKCLWCEPSCSMRTDGRTGGQREGQTDRHDEFKVCKSVHHHSFQTNQPTNPTIFQMYYLTFNRMYSSTCFERPHTHHQELNNYSSSLWFYRRSLVIAVLLFVVGPAGRPNQQHCYHHAPTVRPEAATAVVELLMMGVRTPETCRAVHTIKRQVINLRNCCIGCLICLRKTWRS